MMCDWFRWLVESLERWALYTMKMRKQKGYEQWVHRTSLRSGMAGDINKYEKLIHYIVLLVNWLQKGGNFLISS